MTVKTTRVQVSIKCRHYTKSKLELGFYRIDSTWKLYTINKSQFEMFFNLIFFSELSIFNSLINYSKA